MNSDPQGKNFAPWNCVTANIDKTTVSRWYEKIEIRIDYINAWMVNEHTPAQAREIADALYALADEIEAEVKQS